MRKNVLKYSALKQDASSKKLNIGDSPSGKATDSDSVIRVFESLIPSHKRAIKKISPQKALIFQGFFAFFGQNFMFDFVNEKWVFSNTERI